MALKLYFVGNLQSKKFLEKHRHLVVKPDDNQTLMLGISPESTSASNFVQTREKIFTSSIKPLFLGRGVKDESEEKNEESYHNRLQL